jgi:hypothetical protein
MTIRLVIRLSEQRLYGYDHAPDGMVRTVCTYPVSSAALGVGQLKNSFKTPLGRHEITEKIGDKLPIYSVFRVRQTTGDIWSPELSAAHPETDWILSRILWLSGCELGKNQGGDVDTHERYIYIHGTSEENLLGTPASHGCIRMGNQAIIELFNRVEVGTPVDILA